MYIKVQFCPGGIFYQMYINVYTSDLKHLVTEGITLELLQPCKLL
jgi:hypothetical protein